MSFDKKGKRNLTGNLTKKNTEQTGPFHIEYLVKPTFKSTARYCHSNPPH
jgi:hypothetical protein